MSKIRISKNINSILQVTNDFIYKNNNYRDYIINQNNSLYIRQLPLLRKNERIKALVAKKYDDSQKNSSIINEEETNKNNSVSSNSLPLLKNIRNIKIRSKKLPVLCPLFNEKGELVPSAIKTSKVIYKKINYEHFLNKINFRMSLAKTGKPIFKKLEIKKLKYNKSCDFDLRIKLDDLENNYFNKPEYENLIYDEKEIFENKITYEEIIKNKIIELQTEYNQNHTIQKQKVYKYGLDKKDIILTLDSLKIQIYNIKDENSPLIGKKDEKPFFEYILPFALLPLFYFRGTEAFLIILTKIINFNEKNLKFEIVEKSNEIIAKILKNCYDFFIPDDNELNEKEMIDNDSINDDFGSISKKSTMIQRLNSSTNNELSNENKSSNLNTQFNNNLSSPINKKSLFYKNDTNETLNSPINQNNNLNSNINNNSSTINNLDSSIINNNPNGGSDLRNSTIYYNKNLNIKAYDIWANKINKDEFKIINQYEFFWITPTKSFLLFIETPLITIFAPTNNNYIRQYINYELLFYIYKNNFIMWDFYIMKYLFTLKNFRLFMEKLYSIPKKMNISLFLTLPKSKKLLSTNYEIASIITGSLSDKQKKADNNDLSRRNLNLDNKIELPRKNPKKFISSKTKAYSLNKLNNEFNSIGLNKNRYSKQFAPDEKFVNSSPQRQKASNNENKNNNFTTYNYIFIQKGLLFIASLLNEEKESINEFSIHFNVDQLRKFQIMEIMQDKMSFFMKFMHVDYETEKISFDFEAFKEFDEFNWITEINKYNFNYLSQHQTISEENFLDENGEDTRMIKIFKGMKPRTKIKLEMKCPLIIMQDLDDLCFKVTERVNVDYRVEKILSKISIHNSLDLTKQLISILKDNNFCRKIVTNRNFKKKTTKKKVTISKEKLMMKQQTRMFGAIKDSKEN